MLLKLATGATLLGVLETSATVTLIVDEMLLTSWRREAQCVLLLRLTRTRAFSAL